MSRACGLCSHNSRRSRKSQLSVNLRVSGSIDEQDPATSLQWLHDRVDLLLNLGPDGLLPQPQIVPVFVSMRYSTLGATSIPGCRLMSEKEVLKKRRQCALLMMRLLKRLQSATRNICLAAQLMADDTVCRLLPMAIVSNLHDMAPTSELLLAQTLANLSCHRAAFIAFSNDQPIGNLIAEWNFSPCLSLALCAMKITANFSAYNYMLTLSLDSHYKPHCVYQPDVYELVKSPLKAPVIDVIFVNGMLGSVFYTWKQGDPVGPSDAPVAAGGPASTNSHSDSTSDCDVGPQVSDCWPRDWLPEDLKKARILALNMKISAMKWRGCQQSGDPTRCLPRRANEAIEQLLAAGVGHRLTAFVCHSFGGLIIKQMLQVLHSSEIPLRRKLLNSIRGLVFIAVPHLGRSKAVNVNRIYWRPLRQLCLSEEARNVFDGSCHVLDHLHAWFVQYAQTRADLRVLNIIELSRTPVAPGGISLKVCPESWADKLVGDVLRLPTDHIQICKPPSRLHASYTAVMNFLVNVADCSKGWRPSIVVSSSSVSRALAASRDAGADKSSDADSSSVDSDSFWTPLITDWVPPTRHFEEELRLRYGVSSARALWTRAAWLRFGESRRPRFYDLL